MEHKALLGLLIFFLGFSYVLSSRPVPHESAFHREGSQDPSFQEFVEQGFTNEGNYGLDLEETIIRGRMQIQSNDYPGTGANNHHDPKTPGRS